MRSMPGRAVHCHTANRRQTCAVSRTAIPISGAIRESNHHLEKRAAAPPARAALATTAKGPQMIFIQRLWGHRLQMRVPYSHGMYPRMSTAIKMPAFCPILFIVRTILPYRKSSGEVRRPQARRRKHYVHRNACSRPQLEVSLRGRSVCSGRH